MLNMNFEPILNLLAFRHAGACLTLLRKIWEKWMKEWKKERMTERQSFGLFTIRFRSQSIWSYLVFLGLSPYILDYLRLIWSINYQELIIKDQILIIYDQLWIIMYQWSINKYQLSSVNYQALSVNHSLSVKFHINYQASIINYKS